MAARCRPPVWLIAPFYFPEYSIGCLQGKFNQHLYKQTHELPSRKPCAGLAAVDLAFGARMNFAADFARTGSQRNIHGLRVCDLDWNGALEMVSGQASACDGHTMLSFLTIQNAGLSLKDIAYRQILESCLLLPQGRG